MLIIVAAVVGSVVAAVWLSAKMQNARGHDDLGMLRPADNDSKEFQDADRGRRR